MQTPELRIIRVMARLDYEEIIAIAEDPLAEEDPGQPASVESLEQVARLADVLFFQVPLEEKIDHILHIPADISARRLARMSDRERAEILTHLPTGLVERIVALLPVSAS